MTTHNKSIEVGVVCHLLNASNSTLSQCKQHVVVNPSSYTCITIFEMLGKRGLD